MPAKTIYAILAAAALAVAAPAQESDFATGDFSIRTLAGYNFADCPQDCLSHCPGAEWFGVGLGYCWCDATGQFLDMVNIGPDHGQCTLPCTDGSGDTCGGFDKRNNVVLVSTYLKASHS